MRGKLRSEPVQQVSRAGVHPRRAGDLLVDEEFEKRRKPLVPARRGTIDVVTSATCSEATRWIAIVTTFVENVPGVSERIVPLRDRPVVLGRADDCEADGCGNTAAACRRHCSDY